MKKKSNLVFDEGGMELSAKIIEYNSEYYSSWNYRREFFKKKILENGSDSLQSSFENELIFIQNCIAKSPKSYWIWLHRTWITLHMKADWKMELKLCGKMLDLDERNFHCWCYRRFAAKMANESISEEFKFTTKKIEDNFSNYSAWHQRSALIPQMYEKDSELIEALEIEFELVKNAFYTEPNDQSAWFYHRWLVQQICKLITEKEKQKKYLQKELDMCKELLEVEPNSKWPTLTSVFFFLLQQIGNPDSNIINEHLKKLQQLDPYRFNYYHDLGSK